MDITFIYNSIIICWIYFLFIKDVPLIVALDVLHFLAKYLPRFAENWFSVRINKTLECMNVNSCYNIILVVLYPVCYIVTTALFTCDFY